MKRRDLVVSAGVLGAVAVAGCSRSECEGQPTAAGPAAEPIRWKMVTAWPKNFPGLGTAANHVAQSITAMSGGRLSVHVYGAGELVPAFEVFDAVSSGTAEMGHSASYYWKGKAPAAQFIAGIPFGMNTMEVNAWLQFGGGLDIWRKIYAPFNIVPYVAGNSTMQMGGWFNKEIRSVADLQGLKMRIPGIGGEVLKRAGGVPVSLPGAEIFTSLQSGTIDATEWVGPYNDLAFGLNQAAKYYYYPGWHEPGSVLECMINRDALEGLPADLQAIVKNACHSANDQVMAEYTARNGEALEAIMKDGNVELRRFPADVLDRLRTITTEVLDEAAAEDALSAELIESYRRFAKRTRSWTRLAEETYYQVTA